MTTLDTVYKKTTDSETAHSITILTFCLAEQEYGLPVTAVKQIVEMVTIVHLPQSPLAIQGVINVRGEIAPVLDMRIQFGLDFMPYGLHTPIILIDFQNRLLGLVADSVQTVMTVSSQDITSYKTEADIPEASISASCLSGIAQSGTHILPILNVHGILNSEQEAYVAQMLPAGVENNLPADVLLEEFLA